MMYQNGLGAFNWGAAASIFTTAVSAAGTPKPLVINQASTSNAAAYLAQQAEKDKAKKTENTIVKVALISSAVVLTGVTAYFIYRNAKKKKS